MTTRMLIETREPETLGPAEGGSSRPRPLEESEYVWGLNQVTESG